MKSQNENITIPAQMLPAYEKLLALSDRINQTDEQERKSALDLLFTSFNEIQQIFELLERNAEAGDNPKRPVTPLKVVNDDDTDDDKYTGLHPAWYSHDPGQSVEDYLVADAMGKCMSEIDAIGDLLHSLDLDNNVIAPETIRRIGWMLMDKSREGQNLIHQWIETWPARKSG